jgi:hypothetical protein
MMHFYISNTFGAIKPDPTFAVEKQQKQHLKFMMAQKNGKAVLKEE